MKSATGTVIIFFVLIECRANFTDSLLSCFFCWKHSQWFD